MEGSTLGYLRKEITAEMIYDVICEKYDEDAIFDIKGYEKDKTFGIIYFKDDDSQLRGLFYLSNNTDNQLHDLFEDEYVSLSLGYELSSIEIMTEIVKEFSGYIKENNDNNIHEIYIEKEESNRAEFVKIRNDIMKFLDPNLTSEDKVKIANQIIKNKQNIMSLFTRLKDEGA